MTGGDRALATVVAQWGVLKQCKPISGGSISAAFHVLVDSPVGRQQALLVKRNDRSFEDNFRCEAAGLERLAATKTIAVARPMKVTVIGSFAYLVCQWIETGDQNQFESLGHQLAQLHRATVGTRIGLEHDNYLGSARQINTPTNAWVDFVSQHRIGYQLRWGVDQGVIDQPLRRKIESLIPRLRQCLAGRDESTSLLHGDLWRGNYLFNESGHPTLIDPAVYYGCREAEFGMLLLLGGCPQSFYDAYQGQWPMPAGWQQRVKVYVLYHLLNHLNLFGTGYENQCRNVVNEILRG